MKALILRRIILALLLAASAHAATSSTWERNVQESPCDFLRRLHDQGKISPAMQERLLPILKAYPQGWRAVRQTEAGLDLQLPSSQWLPFHRPVLADHTQRLHGPTLAEMLSDPYPSTLEIAAWPRNLDPGRYRCEAFFRAIYGASEEEVRTNLVQVSFLGRKVSFNRKNGAASALHRVGQRLEKERKAHPEWEPFLTALGGTFSWRKVAGTEQLSAHSFGIAIDLNPDKGAYWRWAKLNPADMSYRKAFPAGIVSAFEAEGFIWGGKWWAYDLMHFEFRPEFFVPPS